MPSIVVSNEESKSVPSYIANESSHDSIAFGVSVKIASASKICGNVIQLHNAMDVAVVLLDTGEIVSHAIPLLRTLKAVNE